MVGISDINAFWALIAQIFAAISAGFGAWAYISPSVNKRVKVKIIKDEFSDDFEEVMHLHARLFNYDVADDSADFRRWLSSRREGDFDDNGCADLLVCAKSDGHVVGYVFCQYYLKNQCAFISYIGIDSDVTEARRDAVPFMLQYLAKYFLKRAWQWRFVIAEVEEYKRSNYGGSFEYVPHAKKLMLTFQHAAWKLRSRLKLNINVYHILRKYWQPALRPEDIEACEARDSRDFSQWLLYIPNKDYGLSRAGSATSMSSVIYIEIIDFLLCTMYADAFSGDGKYREYLSKHKELLLMDIPPEIEVSTDVRRDANLRS